MNYSFGFTQILYDFLLDIFDAFYFTHLRYLAFHLTKRAYDNINNIYFFYIPIQFFTELNALNRPRRHPVAHSSPVEAIDLHQVLILLYFSVVKRQRKTPRIIDNPRHFWQGQKDLPCASHSYGSPTVAVQQYPARRSSLKTVHRTVFLTLRPSRVQVLIKTAGSTGGLLHP